MKIILSTLFLTILLSCNAQLTLKFRTFSLADVREISDSVALNAAERNKFVNEGVPIDNRLYYVLNYSALNDTTIHIAVFFRIDYMGVNQTYQDPGTAQYLFYKVSGQFADLFPFWLGIMKKNAVKAEILKTGKDETKVGGATFDFKSSGKDWIIEKF